MERFDIVFIVLTFRNADDLQGFFDSLENVIGTYKVVVVNSYYDDESMEKISLLCKKNNSIFLNVENKGYSYGNNKGIEYVKSKYEFDFIIVSNPDILIQKLDVLDITDFKTSIIGPKIITLTGKNQNPVYYVRQRLVELFQMKAIKKKNHNIVYISAALNKLNKALHNLVTYKSDRYRTVYALHGSFIIFSYKAIKALDYKPFDDNMFLFAEEDYLAYKAFNIGIKMLYDTESVVKHKEDGSMKLSNDNLKAIALDSLEYLYSIKRN